MIKLKALMEKYCVLVEALVAITLIFPLILSIYTLVEKSHLGVSFVSGHVLLERGRAY
jgi:hypothetical protein